jgi:glutathione S-transferase
VTLGGAAMRLMQNTSDWIPKEQHNAKAAEAAKEEIKGCLRVLDEALAGKQYLLGAEYSLADTHLTSITDWLRHMQTDLAPYANLAAWAKRCSSRPAYAKVNANPQAS